MRLVVLRDGEETSVEVEHRGNAHAVRLGERTYIVDSVTTNSTVRSLVIEGQQFEVAVRRKEGGRYHVIHRGSIAEVEVLDPLAHLAREGSARIGRGGPQKISAYMPGRVVAILVEEGDRVTAGQGIVVLEAMKMENEIQAEQPGVVSRVLVTAGQAVEGGDPLFELE
jgi:pyruvate carboxylase subunit B